MNDCESFRWHLENTNPGDVPSFVKGSVWYHLLTCKTCQDWAFEQLPPEVREQFDRNNPRIPEEMAFFLNRDSN